jgi:hypothetical protein
MLEHLRDGDELVVWKLARGPMLSATSASASESWIEELVVGFHVLVW